jgi:hypothetical protein
VLLLNYDFLDLKDYKIPMADDLLSVNQLTRTQNSSQKQSGFCANFLFASILKKYKGSFTFVT